MAAWGFDISMTNSLQSLTAFNEKFDHPTGARLGFFGASTQVGGAVTIFIAPFLIEKFGRRPICLIGSTIVIAMAIMQVFSRSFDMFTAAKLILGFEASCSQIAAPMLITELEHPIQRARATAMYNTTIYVGLIAGAWIAYGTRNIQGNLSWQIPCVLQVVLPAYQAFTIFLCPESPRWLVMRGKLEQAQNILIKYHGNGTHTPLVQAELEEIIAGIEADASRIRLNKTDIKALLSHKANLHRILIITIVGVGSQCTGSGLISAYLPKVLDGIGMTSTTDKTLINGILNIWTWIVGLSAGYLMPKIKKRALFLTATTGMLLALSVWTGLTAAYDRDARYSYGIGVVAMMFVYNLFYGTIILPHFNTIIAFLTNFNRKHSRNLLAPPCNSLHHRNLHSKTTQHPLLLAVLLHIHVHLCRQLHQPRRAREYPVAVLHHHDCLYDPHTRPRLVFLC
jgi:hypothetical protein